MFLDPGYSGIFDLITDPVNTVDSIWNTISQHIFETIGVRFSVRNRRTIGGGCINTACVIQDYDLEYFVKLNSAASVDMFVAESAGLVEIVNSQTIRAPRPVCFGTAGEASYIVMEYIVPGTPGKDSYTTLGQQLAAMHRVIHPQFGWQRDNTIGSTPQINTCSGDWIEFWRDQRLGYQLKLATRNGYGRQLQSQGDQLLQQFPVLFTDYRPEPSLLHGDLWSGNYAVDSDGNPYIFDPAVYFGDRETDIAMTELFGGFPAQFYQAYEEIFPLDEDYHVRKKLYNLYHILNHLNLFGGGYLGQARQMIDSLLSETG